ncbi:hypothetical protein H2201_003444 [Coniosporium apollinis]|uniref:F-box domain-containing protein n=1 Tax=Coniosporium apollinis TaxID=61459 RepID=A0ABQ9NXS9_9PEZI|nr:hypothetical protein H2201_003444 [Coniosporium apollinis]
MSGARFLGKLRRGSAPAASASTAAGEASRSGSEDTSQRKRPSIVARTSGMPSKLPFRLGKQKDVKSDDEDREERQSQQNAACFGQLLALPYELQAQILCELVFADILALRLTSHACCSMVTACQSDIVRSWTKHELNRLERSLYPPPPPGEAKLQYILEVQRQQAIARKLARHVADFVARKILLRDTMRKREKFQPAWDRMYEKSVPLLFTIGHFLEEYRKLLLQKCVAESEAKHGFRIYTCSDVEYLKPLQKEILTKYDPRHVLECHRMCYFLFQAFEQKLRPPSYASPVEKLMRGWIGKPASPEEIGIVLVLGGLGQVEKIWSQSSYNERRKAQIAFVKSLSPYETTEWRENWTKLCVESPLIPLDRISVTQIAIPIPQDIWRAAAQEILIAENLMEEDEAAEDPAFGLRDFISGLVGFDTRRYASPPQPRTTDVDEDESDGEGEEGDGFESD